MQIRKAISPGMTALVVAALIFPHQTRAEQTIVGRVHNVVGDQVQVCFDGDVAAAIGQEYRAVRHTIAAPAKSPAALRSQHVGAIRIAETGSEHCAKALVVAGEVRALDWIERGDK